MHAIKIFASIAVVLSFSGCHKSGSVQQPPFQKLDAATVEAADMTHLRTTKIESKVFPIIIELPGRITIPDKDIFVLSARVQGRLETVHFTVGDQVGVGAAVAVIWSPDLATAAEELDIARGQNNDSLLRLTEQKLKAMGLDPRDSKRGGSRGYPLRAPIGGVVLERKLNAGAAVQPGDSIMTIGKLNAYQFQGELTPEQASGVKKGMKVIFEGQPALAAHVEAVSPVADPGSRLIRVRCRFDAPPPSSLPQETFLKAQIVLSEVPALVAPAKALMLLSDAEYVFVRVPGDRSAFRRTKVKVQSRTPSEIALSPDNALQAGVEVVSDGALLLSDVLDNAG